MTTAPARVMLRFHRDGDGAWIVDLDCGHRRHIRHRPPLSSFPWIDDAAARAAKVGQAIECDRCLRGEPPDRGEA